MDFAVDAHFHIWNLENFNYPWPTPDLKKIYRNVLADEYGVNISKTPVKYGIFVQCLNNNPQEAIWVLEQTKVNEFIKGIVAGVNLTEPGSLQDDLKLLGGYKEFVGCRHILDMEEVDWIARDDVKKGFEIIGQHGLTFDLLLRPPHLKYIPKLVSSLPSDQKFVINHIAKPYIKEGKLEPWKTEIAEIAKYQNVYCKISGLVTEADLNKWTIDDIRPYVNHIIDVFGTSRLMFGSDFPVCTLANAEYKDVFTLAENFVSHLAEKEKCKIFKENAIKFYNLKI